MINCKKCNIEIDEEGTYSSSLWYTEDDTLCLNCSNLEDTEIELLERIEEAQNNIDEYTDLVKNYRDDLKIAEEELAKLRSGIIDNNNEDLNFDLI